MDGLLNALISANALEYVRSEIVDLRPGSTLIEVAGGNATLSLSVQSSTNLIDWTDTGETSEAVVPAPAPGVKFFRYAN